jgi:asparaginyl-tRNA synthetase
MKIFGKFLYPTVFTRENYMSGERLSHLQKPLEYLSEDELERKRCIGRVTTHLLKYLETEFINRGFEWLLPVIFSQSTDPLWPDPGASIEKRIEIEIYGKPVRATLSMIVQKMVAASLVYPKLFTFSPNVRIERRERATTGIHAYEFTQLDFEIRYASSKDVMAHVEDIIIGLIKSLKKKKQDELKYLGRYSDLEIPKAPFKIYDAGEVKERYGVKWESKILSDNDDPVWVTNLTREFYDFEDFERKKWDNYDLMLPNYGEVLSGSKREYEYDKLVEKMERDGVGRENYKVLLKLAKEGRIKPSAGAGIGIERLISWIVGARHIGEIQPFPRIPGIVYEL